MIIGTGIDLIEVHRVRGAIERHGERLLTRLFTADERRYCQEKANWALHFAGRFAAKEAFSKAIGTGFGEKLSFTDVEIQRNGDGAPYLVLGEKAKELCLKSGVTKWHLSITHTKEYAAAVVILESLD